MPVTLELGDVLADTVRDMLELELEEIVDDSEIDIICNEELDRV